MQTNNASVDPVQPNRSDLWFDDGNLVLEAENTQFRIHRSVICASSTVFKDMFGLTQLVTGDETVEGCPVVQLSDSAADLRHVLKAIYSRGYEVPENPFSSLPIISAFLRLGKKYDISRLYNEAMTVLRQRCPTTLESYDKMTEIAPSAFYVQVVNLALETDTSSLIPAALSLCLRGSSLTNIASGTPKGSGSNTYFLRQEGLRMACLGRERLRQTALRSFVPPCGPDSPCAVRALRALIHVELEEERTVSLEPWGKAFECFELCQCSRCTKALRKHWMDKRKKAWDELPSYYGLPPWEKLL